MIFFSVYTNCYVCVSVHGRGLSHCLLCGSVGVYAFCSNT